MKYETGYIELCFIVFEINLDYGYLQTHETIADYPLLETTNNDLTVLVLF